MTDIAFGTVARRKHREKPKLKPDCQRDAEERQAEALHFAQTSLRVRTALVVLDVGMIVAVMAMVMPMFVSTIMTHDGPPFLKSYNCPYPMLFYP
jgi:hypothetical protein